jgi:putative tRNA adenosine deaminase-associated protein
VLVDVDDEFFVAMRLDREGETRALLSDVTAAADYDLAADVLDLLGEEVPEDLEEVWPAGELDLFADLGLPELELCVILDDLDLYADEMLLVIARRLGFADQLAAAVDMVPH